MSKQEPGANEKTGLLQGTLDLLILRALQLEPMHGFGLSLRLRQMSREVFRVEMGSLYPALCRLEARGWVKGAWGVSESNRKARFYSLTAAGRKQLQEETSQWELLSKTINLMLRAT
jgi:transcriptional regulator